MDAILEHMTGLIVGHGKVVDKKIDPPANSNKSHGSGSTKRNKKKRTHCKKHVFHNPADCYKLDTNASMRWAGWKLVKDNSTLA